MKQKNDERKNMRGSERALSAHEGSRPAALPGEMVAAAEALLDRALGIPRRKRKFLFFKKG